MTKYHILFQDDWLKKKKYTNKMILIMIINIKNKNNVFLIKWNIPSKSIISGAIYNSDPNSKTSVRVAVRLWAVP
jgi:hypothetical protein